MAQPAVVTQLSSGKWEVGTAFPNIPMFWSHGISGQGLAVAIASKGCGKGGTDPTVLGTKPRIASQSGQSVSLDSLLSSFSAASSFLAAVASPSPVDTRCEIRGFVCQDPRRRPYESALGRSR